MTNRADHPRERVFFVREPAQPEGVEPLRVLQRTDGRYVVYDERLPLGRRTAWLGEPGGVLQTAHDAAYDLAGVFFVRVLAVHSSAGPVPDAKGSPSWTSTEQATESVGTTWSRAV